MLNSQLILNRYQPLGEAGSGGFATVQVAWDTRIQRKVAIKCLPLSEATYARDQVPGQSISLTQDMNAPLQTTLTNIPGLNEARTAAMLTDPHIVTVYDFEVQNNTAYLIMEYVEGLTLAQVLREHADEVTLDVVAAVFQGVSHALTMAHNAGVLHLDVKPDNILISKKGQVKVTDFGLATLADAQGYGSADGGTIGYMPLEQIREQGLDVRTDEWSLASVTYEMLTGENPFRARDLAGAAAAIENAEIVVPSLCWESLDPEIDDVLFYALDPNPEGRYASVGDFAEEMEPFLGSAKAGVKDLASIVKGTGREQLEEERAEQQSPRQPLHEQVTPGMRTLAAHVVGAAGTAVLAAVALWKFPQTSGVGNPFFWVPLLVVAGLGAFRPHVGVLLGSVMLAVLTTWLGAPAVGLPFLAATLVWWWFVGRVPVNVQLPQHALRNAAGADNASNAAHAQVLGGAVGLGAIGPLVAGFCLNPARAMLTVLFQVFLAFVLASWGSCRLWGWNLLGVWAGPTNVAGNALGLVADPGFWIISASWVVAAGLTAVMRTRATRTWAVWATVVGGLALIAGAIAEAVLTSGMGNIPAAFITLVDPADLGSIVVSVALVFIFATLVPDFIEGEDA